ncbi:MULTISPECIES: DUF309 domain-containing protein [Halobacillus]|uniref:DUF309 domain-containing protein n=1 Tax=Halobacillus TaxID=45667 RepID=UPI00136A0981|nr:MULTISPECIES: DUF309 domain-containing protein [Halobacillus]MYL28620.1 DUF309 domain-containing protein [Halobacillus halophilus]MYL37949.1 DUF309 domain-containing protein [Halobacillus litoralis]
MYPALYLEYLAHFHGTRDYFECHEVLEEHWKNTTPRSRQSVWVLLIQTAVAMYHDRRGNQNGAATLLKRCINNLPSQRESLLHLGLDPAHLEKQLAAELSRVRSGQPYVSWNFCIVDPQLLQDVQYLCQKWGVVFGSPSRMSDDNLIHKHKRRR